MLPYDFTRLVTLLRLKVKRDAEAERARQIAEAAAQGPHERTGSCTNISGFLSPRFMGSNLLKESRST